MDFYKYHALGNDYIIIDPRKTYIKLNPRNISLICHRNYGIGSDGIIYGPIFKDGNITFHVYNPDGTEAETSGNGINILARYLVNADYIIEKKFSLHTIAGRVGIEILDENASSIKANMGLASFNSSEIPVKGNDREVVNEIYNSGNSSYKITCLSIGNPHCVIPLDNISMELIKEIGPIIENDPMFPNRVNVQIIKIIDRKNINIEIWERGTGYTLASGSCACASARAAHKLGLVDNNINVQMHGGSLIVEIDEKGSIYMTGTVSSVAEGNFTYEMWSNITKSRDGSVL